MELHLLLQHLLDLANLPAPLGRILGVITIEECHGLMD